MSGYGCKRMPAGGIRAVILLLCGALASCESQDDLSTEEQVEGLWRYTRLATSAGREMPLTGIFLFRDGTFLQQAVFDGESFEEQGAMAHAGPYTPGEGSVHLVAEQTISTAPGTDSPLSFRSNTEHDVTVTRNEDELKLVFGSGTIQEFEQIGPGRGEVYSLQDGAVALVDGYFILVQGNEEGVVTGFGTYERTGADLDINVIRWTEADASGAQNRRDVSIEATFDGEVLELDDGRTFTVEK